MCNYSKLAARSRRAKVDDVLELINFKRRELVSYGRRSKFVTWAEKGFCLVGGDPDTVTCLRPGTEVVFSEPPLFPGVRTWADGENGERVLVTDRAVCCEARVAILPGQWSYWRDGVEFANGSQIGFTSLEIGVQLRVLQLPAKRSRSKPKVKAEAKATSDFRELEFWSC